MNDIEKVKGWTGVFLMLWPIARLILGGFGVHLPDLGGAGDLLTGASAGVGTTLVAASPKLIGKKRDRYSV